MSGELSQDEIEGQTIAELPDREALSTIEPNVASPSNLASVVNLFSSGATSTVDKSQVAPITETNP
jgi:hypothetical protein